MRTTKAFLAGLGSTGSLVAGAVCVFAIASAVVAFNGWPGEGLAHAIHNLFVQEHQSSPWDISGPRAVAAAASPAAAEVLPRPSGPVVAPAFVSSRAALGGPSASQSPTSPLPPTGPTSPPTAANQPTHRSPVVVPATPDVGQTSGAVAGAVENTAGSAAGVVSDAGHAAGGAVSRVSPAAGAIVNRTTDAAAGAVNSTGHTIGQIVKGLGGRR